MIITTPRTRLHCWRAGDEEPFAALHSDPEVTRDLGGPITRAASDAKLARYASAYGRCGLCRWALETRGGDFLGYVGVMPSLDEHPLGPHFDVGWRLVRTEWGRGYATEAARSALHDAFTRVGLTEVLAYTSPENLRSQAVMERLGLRRAPSCDFTATYAGDGVWRGMVWIAKPA
jgi:RimJ/RimL family protein N-acetyltransferase